MLGKVDDLRRNQGFYIYRNKRLIIWGTWFRLHRQNELNNLARVSIEIPNTLDHIWEIDVKKSTATLPDLIRRNLQTIVNKSLTTSEKVYKYRGRKEKSDEIQHFPLRFICKKADLIKNLFFCFVNRRRSYILSVRMCEKDASCKSLSRY